MDKTMNIEDFDLLDEKAEWLKAIAHPVRLCMLRGMAERGQCNVSYMHECLNAPQSTISQHVQILRRAGLIKGERDGNIINYSIKDETIKKILPLLFSEEGDKND